MSLPAIADRHSKKWVTPAARQYIRTIVAIFSAGMLTQAMAVIKLEPSAKAPVPAASSAKKVVTPSTAGPRWQELTPAQQAALKPLASSWDNFPEAKKRKWIVIAANFHTLSPDGQAKLHSRMSEWVALSQHERTQARLNFAEFKRLTPDQKTATWEAYQALSPEEKKKLALTAPQKPAGAAPALKPAPPEKLAVIPVTKQLRPPLPPASAASTTIAIVPKSLPPPAAPALPSASAIKN